MKKVIILITVIVSGCAKPEQLPLTLKEKTYFSQLTKLCKCQIDREFDPRISANRTDVSSTYLIVLSNIKHPKPDDTIHLAAFAKKIAFELKEHVIRDKRFRTYGVTFRKVTGMNAVSTRYYEF